MEQMIVNEEIELAVGRSVLERFREHNEARHAEGMRLRRAIASVLAVEPDLNARQVHSRLNPTALSRSCLPSLRAVQWHLQRIRVAPPI